MIGWKPKIVTDMAAERRADTHEAVMAKLAALEIEIASRRRQGIAAALASVVEHLTGITRVLPAHEVWGEDIRTGVQRWSVELGEMVGDMVAADHRLEQLLRGDDVTSR
jgi:hypothetical protein